MEGVRLEGALPLESGLRGAADHPGDHLLSAHAQQKRPSPPLISILDNSPPMNSAFPSKKENKKWFWMVWAYNYAEEVGDWGVGDRGADSSTGVVLVQSEAGGE
jgi:hypothetical protein